MITGPKYKIARRLGAPVFEKTQTQKYAVRAERKAKNKRFSKPKSEFGLQLNEKQKARFTYGITERQFRNYVKEALLNKNANAPETIFKNLELRLDNVVYRIGLAPTRLAARQMVSHGHILVNNKKTNIASRRIALGDVISIRVGSQNTALFKTLDEKAKNTTTPSWIAFDATKRTAEIKGMPQLVGTENMFDLNAVVEFYSR